MTLIDRAQGQVGLMHLLPAGTDLGHPRGPLWFAGGQEALRTPVPPTKPTQELGAQVTSTPPRGRESRSSAASPPETIGTSGWDRRGLARAHLVVRVHLRRKGSGHLGWDSNLLWALLWKREPLRFRGPPACAKPHVSTHLSTCMPAAESTPAGACEGLGSVACGMEQ